MTEMIHLIIFCLDAYVFVLLVSVGQADLP